MGPHSGRSPWCTAGWLAVPATGILQIVAGESVGPLRPTASVEASLGRHKPTPRYPLWIIQLRGVSCDATSSTWKFVSGGAIQTMNELVASISGNRTSMIDSRTFDGCNDLEPVEKQI